MSATQDPATELLVAGAGPGGYVAAIRAAQRGVDVTLVDDGEPGGTCLNYGCIPSKAMLSAAGRVADVADAEEMGIYADPYVDFRELTDWKDGVVDRLTGGVGSLCATNGVTRRDGRAKLLDEHTARIEGPDGTEEVRFERAVVATGSRPIEVPGFDFADDPILDSRGALELDSVPGSLLVVGAGYIGLELSTVFAKLGSDVTVVEMLDTALPAYDDDLTGPVRENLEAMGVTFEFGERADTWRHAERGITVRTVDEGGAFAEYDCDRVLVAVGREPVTDTVGLEAVGVDTDEYGFVPVDDQCRTDCETVFAVGDASGEPMLAHRASHQGLVVADVVSGGTATTGGTAIPAAVFTDPEIATVGHTPDAAREAGYSPAVGRFPFSASGRALSTGHGEGFVRVVADEETGELLGGQVVGPEASELIAEVGFAIEVDATVGDLAGTVHAHPTLSEAVAEAAENVRGEAIHTRNR